MKYFVIFDKNIATIFQLHVTEVLNVHVNESERNLLFLEGFFFQAVKN